MILGVIMRLIGVTERIKTRKGIIEHKTNRILTIVLSVTTRAI